MTPIDALRALLACIDPKQMMSHEQHNSTDGVTSASISATRI